MHNCLTILFIFFKIEKIGEVFMSFTANKNGNKKGFSVYNLIMSLAIIILFVAIGLIVLGVRGYFKFNSLFLLVLLTLFIVSGATLLALPWVRRLQNGQNKILSWVFLGLLVLCAVFWLICAFLLVNNFNKLSTDAKEVVNILNFLKFTLIFTMNYSIASLIATNVIKYRSKMIPFQIILYASNLIVDLYFTFLFCCIHFNEDNLVSFSLGGLRWLINPIVTTVIMIAFIYMIVANAIAKRIERRRVRYAKNDDDMPEEVFGGETKTDAKTTQEKLAELKSMLDQNLITQQEYDQKKADLLSKM